MATLKGLDDVSRYFAAAPEKLHALAREGLRKAAEVVADEARARCVDPEVAATVKVTSGIDKETGRIFAKVFLRGPGSFKGIFLERGTKPHFISVDFKQSGGRTARRVNKLEGEGSLIINGQFVGNTVHHPGARPHPFMRPSLDIKRDEALAEAQAYITTTGARRAGA